MCLLCHPKVTFLCNPGHSSALRGPEAVLPEYASWLWTRVNLEFPADRSHDRMITVPWKLPKPSSVWSFLDPLTRTTDNTNDTWSGISPVNPAQWAAMTMSVHTWLGASIADTNELLTDPVQPEPQPLPEATPEEKARERKIVDSWRDE